MTNREFYTKHKVLFASNGDNDEFNPFRLSFETYSDNINENFILVSSNEGAVYGYDCFLYIIYYALKNGYDYVIYIDADCFIFSNGNLRCLFEKFLDEKSVFGGPGDGGVFCHRNANKYSINPFLSFFNIEQIRNEYIKDGKLALTELCNFSPSLCSETTSERILRPIETYAKYRKETGYTVPHAETISLPSNRFESQYGKNQKVWTFSDTKTAEPYYRLFLGMYNGKSDMSFFYGKDYSCNADKDGITSAVYKNEDIGDDGNLVCLHTWFTRLCNRMYLNTELGIISKNRIFGVGEFVIKNRLD